MTGRIAIVTGAGNGLGATFAEALAAKLEELGREVETLTALLEEYCRRRFAPEDTADAVKASIEGASSVVVRAQEVPAPRVYPNPSAAGQAITVQVEDAREARHVKT